MFLRAKKRFKDGKEHRYWSIVESRRLPSGKVSQRQVLYLGEINDCQKAGWCKAIEVLDGKHNNPTQLALFPDDREAPELACETVQLRLGELSLHCPRQWGSCWLAHQLWEQLQLDRFWAERLPASRKGTRWLNVLKTLVSYRLISPGSEWRLHREWFRNSAMADLLGEDEALVQKDKLYRCLDKLVEHKIDLFSFLTNRWHALFNIKYDVLLYDLTSTYFECDPPGAGKRKFGYSRDKRPDCVQVVIALIVTPDGFPLSYEVMGGNTSDSSTLPSFLESIQKQYGKANRTWVMDRGIPTEKVLADMRESRQPVSYLVGTPKGKLSKLEESFLDKSWKQRYRSTASKQNFDNKTFQIIHPFHPYRNIKFEVDSVRRLAYEHRVFFINTKGRKSSVPLHWTDIGPEDPFVAISAGRSLFRVEDLVGLARLVAGINNANSK